MRNVLFTVILMAVSASGQAPSQTGQSPVANPAAKTTEQPQSAGNSSNTATLPAPNEVLGFLNQTIGWHRQIRAQEQLTTDVSDVLYVNEARQLDIQVVRLSFDFARATAAALAAAHEEQEAPGTASTRFQSLQKSAAAAEAEMKETQAEVEQLKAKIETAPAGKRAQLQAQLEETQSEVNLAATRSQVLRDMMQFMSTGGRGSLQAQIEELQRSVPEAAPTSANATGAAASTTANTTSSVGTTTVTRHDRAAGILALLTDLWSLRSKLSVLDQVIASTDDLTQASKKVRSPMISVLQKATQQGEQLAQEADNADPAELTDLKRRLDALTATFKQLSAVVLPLGKQSILLDSYRMNAQRWREAVVSEIDLEVKDLVIRLAMFGLTLVLVIVVGQIVRTAITRYVHDPRRRYQFLLMRRIVLWCIIGITVAFALASEIGSIATFAGLITAGLAVALQNVILAVAGYFFLIGKYGVRVGDRVQISGVTGEVIDVGLIRLHLMEIGGSGNDLHPTGRVVVFSNSVVFQPTASFYKQIPGTSFVWHEVSLILAPETDSYMAERRILDAVEKVYGEYRDRIAAQHRAMEHTIGLAVAPPEPRSHLRLTQSGLEVVIRYPVETQRAAEVDDKVTRELLEAMSRPPRLKLVGTGVPNIQAVPGTPDEAGPKQVKAS